jgi:hypothetical protein
MLQEIIQYSIVVFSALILVYCIATFSVEELSVHFRPIGVFYASVLTGLFFIVIILGDLF